VRKHDPAVRKLHNTRFERRLKRLELAAESTREGSLSRLRQGSRHLQRFQRLARKRLNPRSGKPLKSVWKLRLRIEAIASPLQGARELQGVERVSGRQLVQPQQYRTRKCKADLGLQHALQRTDR
jgi:hypothetical protein